MGPGETLSLFAAAGVMIGLSIAASQMFERFMAYKQAKLTALHGSAADAEARRAIEQRLQVLERIVTDRGYDVAHQIEALRDNGRDPAPTALPLAERERV